MDKPRNVTGPVATIRWMARQAWSDMKSVYYANTPIWRWFKSGALVFLGFCVWAGASVVLSVQPQWTFLYLVMAYGFLLVLWGPLTHVIVVPLILRLRRTATNPTVRTIVRHGGKINLTIFFTLVVILAVAQPGIMMLEFSPPGENDRQSVSGSLECDEPTDGLIICEIHNPGGFDHVVVTSGGEEIERVDESPFRLEFHERDLEAGSYRVELRDGDGTPLRIFRRSI